MDDILKRLSIQSVILIWKPIHFGLQLKNTKNEYCCILIFPGRVICRLGYQDHAIWRSWVTRKTVLMRINLDSYKSMFNIQCQGLNFIIKLMNFMKYNFFQLYFTYVYFRNRKIDNPVLFVMVILLRYKITKMNRSYIISFKQIQIKKNFLSLCIKVIQ